MTFQHTDPFIPGDTIRAEPVNAAFQAIAVDLAAHEEQFNTRAIRFPAGTSGGNTIPSVTPNSFLWINGAGEVQVYPKATFDSEVAVATAASTSASASASQAAISEYNTRQSELAAAASAELAQQAAVTVAGAAFFAGLWNAGSGSFPSAPEDGSSMWQASTDGTGTTAAIKAGDFIIWDIIATTFRHIPGIPRVTDLSGGIGADLARIEGKADSAIILAAAGL